MNNIQKDIENKDGTIDTLVLTSNDNYTLNLPAKFKLVNKTERKENKITNKFKNSILGTEVGVNAEGFSNIAILATIIAVGVLTTMYMFWRI